MSNVNTNPDKRINPDAYIDKLDLESAKKISRNLLFFEEILNKRIHPDHSDPVDSNPGTYISMHIFMHISKHVYLNILICVYSNIIIYISIYI
jgi:hypothetical protein